METLAGRDRSQTAPQMLAAPGERRIVGDEEVEAHHPEQRGRDGHWGTQRDERSPGRTNTRAGHDARKRETKAGAVTLQVPKLWRPPFETAIIKRDRDGRHPWKKRRWKCIPRA